MTKTELRNLKWMFEFLVLALATIMAYHTSTVASYIFEGSSSVNPVGVLYAAGIELSMVVAAYSLTKSPSLGYSIAMSASLIVSVATSAFAQLIYASLHSPMMTGYWLSWLKPAIDFAPVYMSISLAIIVIVLIIPQLVLSQEARKLKVITKEGVIEFASSDEQAVYKAKPKSKQQRKSEPESPYAFPTKNSWSENWSLNDMIKKAASYYNGKYGQKYLQEEPEEFQRWIETDNGQAFVKHTNFEYN